jgi:hypothetical protein
MMVMLRLRTKGSSESEEGHVVMFMRAVDSSMMRLALGLVRQLCRP